MERLKGTQYPNWLIRIIKFLRIFGFSFIEAYDGINKSLFYYFKKYLMIFYNLLVIMFFIGTQLLNFPKMNESLNILKSKLIMNAVFFTSILRELRWHLIYLKNFSLFSIVCNSVYFKIFNKLIISSKNW
jgi:hypothetical protein